jgi:polyferredoxin
MHGTILIGAAASLVNIAVHAMIMAPMTWSVHRMWRRGMRAHAHVRLVLVMIATVSVLMMAHLLEVSIWALVYIMLDVAPNRDDAFYFAFVNYTTLGYGDIVPVPYWRILGPLTAMNGVLLFGWSTAVIFDVLRKAGSFTSEAS